jgi:hypothetical protein
MTSAGRLRQQISRPADVSRPRLQSGWGTMMTYYRAWENRRFVRTLLREKQPEFADVLESAVREAPCLRCHGSRCSEADELTLLRPSHPTRHITPAGRTVRGVRPARARRPQPSRSQ